MKFMKKIIFIILISTSLLGANPHQKYKNLGNPTEYIFDFPVQRIEAALDEITPSRIGDIVIYKLSQNSIMRGFTIDTGYYPRYWDGPIERDEDVKPSEAGKIGEIDGTFDFKIESIGDKTRIKVEVAQLQQQVGRTYRIFPHFRKTGVYVRIKSDTYFEYLFLSKFGSLLGQKGMPPLNDGTGKPVDINAIPVTKLDQ